MQVWNGNYVSNGGPVARVDATVGETAQLLSSGTITASANVGPFFLENANAVWFYWEITSISGSGAALTVIPQSSATSGGSYNQFLTSGSQTATGNGVLCTVVPSTSGSPNQWFRLNLTVAGTSPSIKYAVYAVPFFIGENA